jgi:cytochrome c-type biogenesis protein CcmH/NrfG
MTDVFLRERLKIARKTLRMNDVGVLVMGGMTKAEARQLLREQSTSDAQYRRTIRELEGE